MAAQDSFAPELSTRSARTPEETRRHRRFRLPFLGLGVLCFAAAIYGGLWRLGWALPHAQALGELHGPLMIGGFFGTLIGLERAVALGRHWVFAAPVLSICGALLLMAGAPHFAGGGLLVAAAVVLTLASLLVLRDERQLFTGVLAGGSCCWATGHIVWLVTGDVAPAAPWWLLFLVLTIAAERLDMSRLLGIGARGRALFAACILLLLAGAVRGMFTDAGALLLGTGFALLAIWLAFHDIAFRNLRRAPHLRYFGRCMCAGYGWMAVAGLALILAPPAVTPFGYDMVLHAILIGFVLSMALGHSVIVIPAITGAAAPYHPAMYIGLGFLHASIGLRIGADALAWGPGRLASGPLTIAGLIAFGIVLARQIAHAARRKRLASSISSWAHEQKDS